MGARLILLKESTMDPSAMVNVGAEWDGCLEDGENSEEQPDISCERDESHARIGINGKLPPQPQDSQPPMRYRSDATRKEGGPQIDQDAWYM
ncbi:hypothetical protein CCMA1212_004068 [Trichoderma ghanense]|uniref:Uncharacterized protein n=1 Tax=Trichoderma ghanense TaxID=65468 RepID=A0ABY2H9V2_9HYPO